MVSETLALTWYDAIFDRHSTRNYDGRPVPDGLIDALAPPFFPVSHRYVKGPALLSSQTAHLKFSQALSALWANHSSPPVRAGVHRRHLPSPPLSSGHGLLG